MKKRLISALLVLLLVVSLAPVTMAEDSSYIEIRTVEDLYCVRNNLAGHYILMNDIDLTEATAKDGEWDYSGKGWWPIGYDNQWQSYSDFTGVFDGNGYSIIGMRIDADAARMGLFVSVKGVVRDLNIQSANIKNSCSSTKTSDCPCTGTIAAVATGVIEGCSVSGSIWHREIYSYVGGIVGYSKNATIKHCCNMSTIQGSNYVGGIVGFAAMSTIQECYNLGSIQAWWDLPCALSYIGGIAGLSSGTITDCYNVADVTEYCSGDISLAKVFAGGITGTGNATHCYNIGHVRGGTLTLERVSGFHKDAISNSGTLTQCYYLMGSADSPKATPLSETQIKLKSMYFGFDFNEVWMINNTLSYPYPQLRFQPQVPCDHAAVENIYEKTPTCTVDGYTQGTRCKYCGEILSGLIVLPAAGHHYSEKWSYSTLSHWHECNCGDRQDKSDHVYQWKYDTKFHWKECFCGSKTDSTVHTFENSIVKKATCEENGTEILTCSDCGYSYTRTISAAGHNYGDWKPGIVATHVQKGFNYRVCSNCGNIERVDVPAMGHAYDTTVWRTDAASHWHTCSCGAISSTAAHSFGSWVTTTAATHAASGSRYRICSECGYKQEETIPATGHSYSSAWNFDATYHWHTCACGAISSTAAHSFGDWRTVTEATRTTEGLSKRACAVCGWEETKVIPSVKIACGDVNDDGSVNQTDLTVLSRHVANLQSITGADKQNAADYNGDGTVTAADLTALARYLITGAHSAAGVEGLSAKTG